MMHETRPTHLDLGQLVLWLLTYRWRWIAPAVVVTAAAMVFALLKPSEWEASQALTIRNEAANNEDGPGKFGHSDERRTAQETVLELAKSRAVLAEALKVAGPPSNRRSTSAAWPSDEEVDDFREDVTLTPPKGAELGRTEVFYLTVRDRDRQRAVELVAAVRDQLEQRYQQLRDTNAKSMSAELQKAVEMARNNLSEVTARVAATEAEVGEDLADLRMLHNSLTGETSLQRTATEIRNELRQVQNARASTEELTGLLREAQKDPQRLVATPNRLLESQPGLRQLKQGLVEAQLRTAALLGQMSELHPTVIAARESEQEVRRNIHAELAEAISGLELESRLQKKQEESLQTRLNDLDGRLAQLASLRATYGSNLAEMENRAELLRQAEDDLAQAEASQVGADAASLIGRIDVPTAGTRPAGPGRKTIVLVGAVAGLLAGLGLLVLTTPMPGAEWDLSNGSPEVVVVVESSENLSHGYRQELQRPEDPRIETASAIASAGSQQSMGEDSPSTRQPEKTRRPAPAASKRREQRAESDVVISVQENVRMPEHVFSQDDASGMTLKEALQRIGPG